MRVILKMCFLFQLVYLVGCSVDDPESPRKPVTAQPPVLKVETPPAQAAASVTDVPLKVAASQPGAGALFAYFAEHPQDLDVRDADRMGLFHWLAQMDRTDLVKQLVQLEMTSLVTAKDKFGRIPLHYAKSPAMVTLLWNYPVRIKMKGDYVRIVPAGESMDQNGQLPVHRMVATAHEEALAATVEIMCRETSAAYALVWGSPLTQVDRQGQTPRALAMLNKDLKALRVLDACSLSR